MKKFLPLFLISLFVSAHSSAQELRYGITGAMNVANYAMDVDGISFDTDSRIGFRAGFRLEMDAPFIYEGFFFDGEVALSAKGSKFSSTLGDEAVSVISRPYYLEIPIHIGYRYMLNSGKVGLFGEDKVTEGDVKSKPDSFSSDGLKRFDFGVGLRGGITMFDHYQIYVGYDWGLINVAQIDGSKLNNRNFYVGAAYMF